jgi:hypothetical protein
MANVGFTVTDYDRFVVRTSDSALVDKYQNVAPAVDLEFLVGPAGLPHESLLRAKSATASTATFAVDVAADTPPGTYAICYCDASADSSLNPSDIAASYVTTSYTPTFDATLTGSTAWPAVTVGARLLADHLCVAKCGTGCLGSDCHCDGMDHMTDSTYCLDIASCRAACDLVSCAGFAARGDACELAASAATTPAPGWTSYTQHAGAACRDVDDFTKRVGTVTVTARAYVGVEYVVTPDEELFGIEVTGSGLLVGDDVYVGRCNEPCGSLLTWDNYLTSPSYYTSSYYYVSATYYYDHDEVLGRPPMVIKRFVEYFWKFSAGCHKLCFCDVTLAPSGVCEKPGDYSVELGEIHASGVSCLLENSMHSRKSCLPMKHGGLRCYDELSAAVTVTENPPAPTPEPTAAPLPPSYVTKCLLRPEEEREKCTEI